MLPGTSVNYYKRLFSQAKFILSDTRKRTNAMLFEALLLLKVNASFWDVFFVGQAMGWSKISQPQAGGGTDNTSDVAMLLSDLDYVDDECNEYDSNEDDNHRGPCALTTSSVSLSLTS